MIENSWIVFQRRSSRRSKSNADENHELILKFINLIVESDIRPKNR